MASFVVAVPREDGPGERRVALAPEQAHALSAAGFEVLVEPGAGRAAGFADDAYAAAGGQLTPTLATVRPGRRAARRRSPLRRPGSVPATGPRRDGHLGAPQADPSYRALLADRGVTAFSFDGAAAHAEPGPVDGRPDVAGQRGRLQGGAGGRQRLRRLLPDADDGRRHEPAGPVLVLGAGVAGLQAIATARRLGAVVSAYDIRPAARAGDRLGRRDLRRPA